MKNSNNYYRFIYKGGNCLKLWESAFEVIY